MGDDWLEIINPIKIIVAAVTLYAFLGLSLRHGLHRLVLAMLFVAFCTEVVNSTLKFAGQRITATTNVGILIFFLLWLAIMYKVSDFKKLSMASLLIFSGYGLINLMFIDQLQVLNCDTFVIGSLLYISLYFVDTWQNFSNEQLEMFERNSFVLISAPVVFMAAMSMMFAFDDPDLNSTTVWGNVTLYSTVIYIVNLIFYFLIAAFISGEKKLAHV